MYRIVQRAYYPSGNEMNYYFGSPPVVEEGFKTKKAALARVREIRASDEACLYEKNTGGSTRMHVEPA